MNENNQNNNLSNTNFGSTNDNFQNLKQNQNNVTGVPQPQTMQPNLNSQMPESKINENIQQPVQDITNSTPQPQTMQPNLNFQMPESKINENIQQPVQDITNSTPQPQPMQPNLNFQMPASGINGNIQQPVQDITNTNTYPNQPLINNLTQAQPKQKTNKNIIIIAAVIIIVAVIAVIFFLNRTTTLVCTDSETSAGMEMTMEATMKFKKDELQSMKAVMTVDLGNYANRKDDFIEILEETYSDSEYDDIDVKITSDENKVYVTMKADKNKFENLGLITTKNIDEARKELEEEGFSCK